ncbi:hypothetical protein [Ilyobacter sp.]|uniref:hypothetical protein n=1 Tax=Ilyobacter sp. TaxID=3100343 RepID=UPI0035683565
MEKIILEQPVKEGDKEIKELNLDLESLTTQDFIDAEKELLFSGEAFSSMGIESSLSFRKHIAAKSAGVRAETIGSLKAKDWVKVSSATKGFLEGTALAELMESLAGNLKKSV